MLQRPWVIKPLASYFSNGKMRFQSSFMVLFCFSKQGLILMYSR